MVPRAGSPLGEGVSRINRGVLYNTHVKSHTYTQDAGSAQPGWACSAPEGEADPEAAAPAEQPSTRSTTARGAMEHGGHGHGDGACVGRRSRCAPPLGVGAETGHEGDAAQAGEPIDEAEPLGEEGGLLRGALGEGLLRLGHKGREQRRLAELLVAHLVSRRTSGVVISGLRRSSRT